VVSSQKGIWMCSFCMFLQVTFNAVPKHVLSTQSGQLIFPYIQTSWFSVMCSMENESRQRRCLLLQRYVCFLPMFSGARFLIVENAAQDVGQHWTVSVQLLQILWHFVHSFMGGTVYSMHTGHFSSLSKASWRARDKSSVSRTQVSHVSACC
jgi:hypothetical protein